MQSQEDIAAAFDRDVIACRCCPRLIQYCRDIGQLKRRAYRDWEYWARPVPSFGPIDARLLILGLAPGAHGANRTGRVFTGDSSGNLLYRVLHQTGFASQPTSVSRDDGMHLVGARISCAAHCAPPDNKPLPQELRNCRHWLRRELALMRELRAVVALGRTAFDDYLAVLREQEPLKQKPCFGHNAAYDTGIEKPVLIGSYHPSQQNTSTGKLTEPMLLAVFERARAICESERCELPETVRPVS